MTLKQAHTFVKLVIEQTLNHKNMKCSKHSSKVRPFLDTILRTGGPAPYVNIKKAYFKLTKVKTLKKQEIP